MSFESQEKYDQHFKEFMDEWKPQSKSEFELVQMMANSTWRLRRTWMFETALFDSEMFTQADDYEAAWTTPTSGIRFMDTVTAILATNPASLDVLDRYENRYDRLYHRALAAMQKSRHDRGLPPIEDAALQRPEPTTPAPEPPPPPPPSTNWLMNWLQTILTLLQAILVQSITRTPTTKIRPKTAPRTNEPTPYTASPFTTIHHPEAFGWFTDFIPCGTRPEHKANN